MERLKLIASRILMLKGFFTVDQIAREIEINQREIRIVLNRLSREGLLQRFEFRRLSNQMMGRPRIKTTYQIADKKKLQNRISPKNRSDSARDRMWKVIRYLNIFTYHDLIRIAEVSRAHVKLFTQMLHHAGIIKPLKSIGLEIKWMIIQDPGPKRPYLSRNRETKIPI